MFLRKIILAILCIVCTVAIRGANNINSDYLFSHIKISDGLPHQQVQTMAFDRIGRLWIGTRNGLACYDGYSFKTYYHIPGDKIIYGWVQRKGYADIFLLQILSAPMMSEERG